MRVKKNYIRNGQVKIPEELGDLVRNSVSVGDVEIGGMMFSKAKCESNSRHRDPSYICMYLTLLKGYSLGVLVDTSCSEVLDKCECSILSMTFFDPMTVTQRLEPDSTPYYGPAVSARQLGKVVARSR
jgi:hypothetical protein